MAIGEIAIPGDHSTAAYNCPPLPYCATVWPTLPIDSLRHGGMERLLQEETTGTFLGGKDALQASERHAHCSGALVHC